MVQKHFFGRVLSRSGNHRAVFFYSGAAATGRPAAEWLRELMIFLQIIIALTGNYCSSFNLLTLALCLLLIDDAFVFRMKGRAPCEPGVAGASALQIQNP